MMPEEEQFLSCSDDREESREARQIFPNRRTRSQFWSLEDLGACLRMSLSPNSGICLVEVEGFSDICELTCCVCEIWA